MQFPFYNCRKLAQLPVKICPGERNERMKKIEESEGAEK